jgi:fumarate hydratase class II
MLITRIEKDSLGDVEVSESAYWGAQTERARLNFQVSGLRFPRRFIAALGMIKGEATGVNVELGVLDQELADAVRQAAREVAAGGYDDHFPLDIFQTGSGTSTNMNANEVIANRAIELLGGKKGSKTPVHPNDHVNAGQSSNDVIPTAIHVSAYGAVAEELEPALDHLAATLEAKARERSGAPISRTRCPSGWVRSSRLMPSKSATPRSGWRRPSRGWRSWRSAAPPSAPGSTPTPSLPTG